jgi:hypothetical protein
MIFQLLLWEALPEVLGSTFGEIKKERTALISEIVLRNKITFTSFRKVRQYLFSFMALFTLYK